MSKINLEQLRIEVQNMKRHQEIYKVLKEELSILGFWRNRPRGNPLKGFNKGWGKRRSGQ